MNCEFATFFDTPCEGRIQRAHWIPKQRLRIAFKSRGMDNVAIHRAVWSPYVWSWACAKHHHALDNGFAAELSLTDFPEKVHRYANEMGFHWEPNEHAFRASHNGPSVPNGAELTE